MSQLVRLTEEALLEYQQALDWYASQRVGLESEFQDAIDSAFARIMETPNQFPLVGGNSPSDSRRCLVGRFPYAVMFRQTSACIRVLAIAHLSRRPTYWRKRK